MGHILWVLLTWSLYCVTGDKISLRLTAMAPALPRERMFSLTKIEPAIRLGIAEVEKRQILPNHLFNLTFVDTRESAIVGPVQFFNFIQQGGENLFLGPVADYTLSPVGGYAPFWNVPILTPGGLSHDFRKKRNVEYKTLTRIGPGFDSAARFLVDDVMKMHNWKRVSLIYDTDDRGLFRGYDFLLGSAFIESFKSSLSSDVKFDLLTPDRKHDEILKDTVGSRFSVVVLCASADSVRDIMIKANELNFDNGEYVFLNIDLFSSKEDSEKPWYREYDTPERNQKAKKAYEALMTVTLRKPTSPAYRNFSEEVKRRAGNDSFTYGEDEVNSFVGAFHDAVILYALALNETLANNRSITNGTEITHRMWNRTFEGITGTVSIDSNGDRNADYSLLDMNPENGKFEVVANYFGKDKKYLPVPHKKIHWAGNRKSAPPDTPKCGFDGAKCPPEKPFPEYGIVIIVLGTLLVIVLVAAFFIYRHIKLEAELAEMNWRVRWDDIMFGTMENDRKMRRQGSNLSLTRTTNGEACAEGRVLIERSDAHELDWCQCGQCEAAEGPTKRVCCRQLELYGIFQEGGTCITSNKEFREVVLNRDVLLAVFIHVMLVRRQRGVAPVNLSACKLRLMATRQFLCWMHRGQKLKKESRMAVPSCVSRAIRIEFPDGNTDDNSRGSVTESSLTGVIPLDNIA